jgi:threonine aldolase
VASLKKHLEAQGIVALAGPKMRLATHLDVDAAGIDRAISVFGAFFQRVSADAAG